MDTANSATENWTFAKKACFRFFFCFFMFQFFLGSALYVFIFSFNFALYDWFEKLYARVYDYINNHFLHLKQVDTRLTVNGFLFIIIGIVTAVVVTVFWSAFDKKRKSYTQADFWLRHILKYVLAIIIFSYGIDKLIPDQMQLPSTKILDISAGNFPPGWLFWTLMGSHTFYESFTGAVEVAAAFLLVFSRTYAMGLIILSATLINVLMLNISFDIGVTYFVIGLLVAVMYLLFPFLKSILYFLFSKQPAELYKQPKPGSSKLYKAIFISSYALFIVSAIFNTTDSLNSYTKKEKGYETTRTFNVTNQTYMSDTLKMVVGDKARWKYWIEYKKEGKNYLSLITMNDTVSYNLLFDIDTIKKVIHLKPEDNSGDTMHYTFSYSIDNKKGDKTLVDSLHKMTLVIKEFNKENWELLKNRNKFFPFDTKR